MLRPALLAAPVLLAAPLLLAGCSQPSSPLGPQEGGKACIAYHPGVPVTVGAIDVRNSGPDPVTIHGVSLVNAQNLQMSQAWLVPVRNKTLIGSGEVYPPTASPVWAQRTSAVGAVVKPGQDLNLVFGLTWTSAKQGTADGEQITYTSNNYKYTLNEQVSVTVAASCAAQS